MAVLLLAASGMPAPQVGQRVALLASLSMSLDAAAAAAEP